MNWETPLFLAVAGSAFGYSGYRLLRLYRLALHHKDHEFRLDRIPERIATTIENVLGQRAVMRKRWIGRAHATIFWGFLIITVGTLEQFVSTLHRGASFEFIGAVPYQVLVFLQDFFTVAVFIAILGAAYRRLVVRPPALGSSRDANIILLLTGLLMVSILCMNGFHLLAAHPSYEQAMPFSRAFAHLLGSWGGSTELHENLSLAFKWIHMVIVLGYAMYIPTSKHLHVLAAGPNTFLKTLDRQKPMSLINFEDEKITQYGAAKISDMGWKDALDYYSCTECGRCQDLCPAWNTQKPLSPKHLIVDLKHNLFRNQNALLAKNYDQIEPVIDQHVTEDVIWACTSCRACEIACPVFIEQVDKIYDIRRNLVMMESRFPPELQSVFKNLETNASPWAFSPGDRAQWAQGLGIKTVSELSAEPAQAAAQIDVLLWVGCAGAFDDRNKKVLRSFASLLKKADIKFAILGTEEQCTGDPARRIGNEFLFQTLAKANVETLNKYQIKKVVTSCPHCFNTLKNEYKDFGVELEVHHHSQFIAELLASGKIKPTSKLDQSVTFHDSCYLGRWNGEYNAPRAVIGAVTQSAPIEMKSHHDQSLCCGAGGGRMWMEEKLGTRINVKRTEQAIETKAQIVAASCPFCMTMMTDGVKAKDMQDSIRVMDIAELVDQSTA